MIWGVDYVSTPLFPIEVYEMNEKGYKKRLEFQQKTIARQSQQIESLSAENAKLRLQIEEKNNVINDIEPMRKELAENIEETKRYKEEFKLLIQELKKMKSIVDQEVYRGRWKIIKFLMK